MSPRSNQRQEELAKAKIISWVKAAVAGERPPALPLLTTLTDSDFDEHGMVLFHDGRGISVGLRKTPEQLSTSPRLLIRHDLAVDTYDLLNDGEIDPDDLAEALAYLNPSLSGASLRAIREGMGLTASFLAKYLQVQTRTVQRWESGERGISKTYCDEILGLRHYFYGLGDALADQAILPDSHPAKVDTDGFLDTSTPLLVVLTDDSMPPGWHRALGWHLMQRIPKLQLLRAEDADERTITEWRALLHRVEDLAERRVLDTTHHAG